jgi:pimeloyl-ACP methyl ester carboxylesterase
VGRVLFHDPARVAPEALVMEHGRGWRENYAGRLKVAWGVTRQLAAPAPRRAFVQRRARLTVPTLIVWGANDRLLPVSHAHSGRALVPDSRLHVFPDCGHAPNLEYPDEFNRLVVDFLAADENKRGA